MTQSLSQAAASDGEGPPSERWWQHLDPRRHIAAAVGWAVFILMTLGALIAGGVAASTAEREMRADTRARLVQTAGQTADALLDDLFASLTGTSLLVITHDENLMARCDRVVDLGRWAVRGSR